VNEREANDRVNAVTGLSGWSCDGNTGIASIAFADAFQFKQAMTDAAIREQASHCLARLAKYIQEEAVVLRKKQEGGES